MKKLLLILLMTVSMTGICQQNKILAEVTGNVKNNEYATFIRYLTYFQHNLDLEIVSYNKYSTDPYSFFDSQRRLKYYGQPYFIINGKKYSIGNNVVDTLAYFRDILYSHLEDKHTVKFDIGGSVEILSTNTLYRFQYSTETDIEEKYTIHVAITDNEQYHWIGGDTVYGITRKMVPSYQGKSSEDINGFYTDNFFLPNEYDKARMVVFAQDENKNIIGCKAMYLRDLNYLGVEDTKKDANSFNFYPNPCINIVHFKGVFKHIIVYNQLGVIVLKTSKNSANLSNLPAGIYYIRADQKIPLRLIKR